jgi:predicted O-methyltransferase YrrM
LLTENKYFWKPYLIILSKNMSYYTIKKYLNYRLFSAHKRGHGIHSPFVFDLIEKVFRNKTAPTVVLDIEALRKKLNSDKRVISVTDMGAGSKRIKGNLRKISDIARFSSVPPKYGRLLTAMAASFGDTGILELGSSLGISTMYLAAGQKDGRVYTIEGCPATLSVARENFGHCGFTAIRSYSGSFDEMIPEFCDEGLIPGIVFIDGDHRKESVIRYFEKAKEFTGDKSVIIFDDIHTSAEMGEAWEEIKRDKKISITIDILRFGIVFFRGGMTRSDYVIRY